MRLNTKLVSGLASLAAATLAPLAAHATVDFGKPGEKVNLVVVY